MPVLEAYWPPLIEHEEQTRLLDSPALYRVLAAGRGGGKGENAGRILIQGDEHHLGLLEPLPDVPQPMYWIAAPTRDQVKMIWWDRLKGLLPEECIASISESELWIRTKVGSTVRLVGLDKPHRAEGAMGVDGLIVDEYAEVKSTAWTSSLEPAVNRRGRRGWTLFIGRPKGRGHFYDLWARAKTAGAEWDSFKWTSEPVLGKEHLERIRLNCDELTFRQEYLADWITFTGLAYYVWSPNDHYKALRYDPSLPLCVCLDFNVEPGAAALIQEQFIDDKGSPVPPAKLTHDSERTTCVIGEVRIPRNSNTPAVCDRIIQDYRDHKGEVHVYGDPSGGARHTSQVSGTDWQIVEEILRRHFGDRVRMRVARRQPPIRDRINCVNSRLKSASGKVRLVVDPNKAPTVVKDFEGVTLLEGGSGEVDKVGCERNGLTHWTEAIGYYVHEVHPIGGNATVIY